MIYHLLNNFKENIDYAINKVIMLIFLNTVMDSISVYEGVDIIPFNEFIKTQPLERFMISKAQKKKLFIGDYLIRRTKLPKLKK